VVRGLLRPAEAKEDNRRRDAYNLISALPFQHSSWILFYLPLRTRDCYEVLNDSQQPQHPFEARCGQTVTVAASPFQLVTDAHHF
jgi:hypothetical protein